MNGVSVTVVMPAYNEQDGIHTAVAAVQTHILDKVPGAELLIVNDGSRDNTAAIVDAIVAADARVRALHTPNGGHGMALVRGLAAATGEYVFLIDSDDQIPLDPFEQFWSLAHESDRGLDGVFGIRRVRHDAQLRIVLTSVIRAVLMMLFSVRITDSNVPFKLVRRRVWLDAKRFIPDDTLAPSLFLALYMKRAGCDIRFVDVVHRDRVAGEVSIRRWKLVKFCARAFRQLLQFRSAIRHV